MRSHWWKYLLIIPVSSLIFSGCTFLEKQSVAGLQVMTENDTAAVFLNDQYLDRTPLINKQLKPGTYQLRLEPNKPSLASYQTQIVLRKNLLTVVNWQAGESVESSGGVIYELEPISGKRSEISFITIPDNVLVKLDDKEQTFSPITYQDLTPGSHSFSLFLTAYEKQKHTLEVPQGHRVTVTAKLARLDDETFINEVLPEKNTKVSAREASLAAQLGTKQPTATQSGRIFIQPTGYFEGEKEVLKVRAEPDITSDQIGVVTAGKSYPFLDKSHDWYQILFANQTGWISASYAQLEQD